ncbi:MAG TPA: hypothetical protein VGD50_00210, partial [Candidatus Baltobacteraceae bacterium]
LAMVCVEYLAAVLATSGSVRCATRLLGHTDAYFRCREVKRRATELACFEVLMERIRAALAPDEIDGLLAEGAGLGLDLLLAEAAATATS